MVGGTTGRYHQEEPLNLLNNQEECQLNTVEEEEDQQYGDDPGNFFNDDTVFRITTINCNGISVDEKQGRIKYIKIYRHI